MQELTHGCTVSPPAGSRQLLWVLQTPLPTGAEQLFSLQHQYGGIGAFVLGLPVCFPCSGFLWSCRHRRPGQAARQGRDGAGCCCEPMPPDGSILPAPPHRTPQHPENRAGAPRRPPAPTCTGRTPQRSSKPLLFIFFPLLFAPERFPSPSNATRRTAGREGGELRDPAGGTGF